MRDFISVLREIADPMWRQEEDDALRAVDPDNETFHVQADGFWGFEKGFHDAEELRRR